MARENVRAKARGLGAELADLREQAGMTMREVADRLDWSASTLCRIENGMRDSTPEEIAALLVVYKITGARNDRMVSMAKTIDQSGWWEFTADGLSRHLTALRAFEAEATRLTDVSMLLIPGLLQTPEYAGVVMEASGVDQSDDRVAIRTGRQAVLGRRKPPELHAIIDEAVLRRPLGGAEIMAAQLRKLVREAARPHITSSAFLDDEEAVRTFRSTTVTLSQQALDPMRSQEFLTHLAQRYEAEAGAATHGRRPAGMA